MYVCVCVSNTDIYTWMRARNNRQKYTCSSLPEWAGVAQLVKRRAAGWRVRVQFPTGARESSLLLSSQTGSGFPPRWELFLGGVKQPGHETDYSPPSNAELKNDGAIQPLTLKSSWHCAYLYLIPSQIYNCCVHDDGCYSVWSQREGAEAGGLYVFRRRNDFVSLSCKYLRGIWWRRSIFYDTNL
jgi:hypothetical protein